MGRSRWRSVLQEPCDVGQADIGPTQKRDTTCGGDLIFGVTEVAGGSIDTSRYQQAMLVVEAQCLDREPSSREELGTSQFLHDAIMKRVPGARSRRPRPGASGWGCWVSSAAVAYAVAA